MTETPLLAPLVERIERSGPMPFAAYMSLALYHPTHGYYAAGARRTGWRGHFLTSPELDPAFGELWLHGFESMWESAGRPAAFHVVEIGPGEAGFARALLEGSAGAFAAALRVHLVERVPAVAARQRASLGADERALWHPSITDVPALGSGCVFANEVLDNLPVHLVRVVDGRLKEVCVELDERELVLRERPPSSPELAAFVERTGVVIPEGHTFEIGLAAESLIARAASVMSAGAIVFVDYGHEAEELAARPEGSLLCYSETGVDAEPLDRPGMKDITVHANWTAVAAALGAAGFRVQGPAAQRDVLLGLGARSLDADLKARHRDELARGRGGAAVAALSRRQALGALLDPGGLGGLQVVAGTRPGIELDLSGDQPGHLSTG